LFCEKVYIQLFLGFIFFEKKNKNKPKNPPQTLMRTTRATKMNKAKLGLRKAEENNNF